MGYAFKFAYEGTKFTGFQKGNGLRSVEDTVMGRLRSGGIDVTIRTAARTDRGVSALSNVMYLDSEEKPEKLAGIINSGGDDIMFHSYAMVGHDFRPRHCDMKVYRYVLPWEVAGRPHFIDIIKRFVGTHDFSHFSRTDGRNPVRSVEEIEFKKSGDIAYIDFYAQSFLWNQIRSMIAFADHFSLIDPSIDPFQIKDRFPNLAEPRHLILMDIFYSGINFIPLRMRKFARKTRKELFLAASRLEFVRFLDSIVNETQEDFSYPFNRMSNDHR
jgi:tRNA pseudouridine38-40 synthase